MTSVFEQHGIQHLSASQLSTFCADSSFWFAQKVLGLRTPASFAMERGKAVETGIVAHLAKGSTVDEAKEIALNAFDEAGQYGGLTGDADKERDAIPGMVEQGIMALAEFGKPDFPEDGQHKISFNVRFGEGENDVVPLIGFLDLVYEDRIIDIKSTLRVPSEMSFSHRLQCAIYSRSSGNKDIAFCYISPKKSALLRPENIAADQELVRNIVKRMAAFLALGDKETLRAAVPIVFDSWSWRGLEHERQKHLGV